MSDLSPSSQTTPPTEPAAGTESPNIWAVLKKVVSRLQDWFSIQSAFIRIMVVSLAVLIPATAIYSVALLQKQAAVTALSAKIFVSMSLG